MDEPKRAVAIDQWRGLYTNADPHDLHPGASAEQTNLEIRSPGMMAVRKGIRPVTFANAIAATTDEIVAMVAYHRPEAEWILYELSSGLLKAGRGAT